LLGEGLNSNTIEWMRAMPEVERFFESARFLFRLEAAREQAVCGVREQRSNCASSEGALTAVHRFGSLQVQDPHAAAMQPKLVPPKPYASEGAPGSIGALYPLRDRIADPSREPTPGLADKVLKHAAASAARLQQRRWRRPRRRVRVRRRPRPWVRGRR
jgi:hypothetical protein